MSALRSVKRAHQRFTADYRPRAHRPHVHDLFGPRSVLPSRARPRLNDLPYCSRPITEIDRYGERLFGWVECHRWTWRARLGGIREKLQNGLKSRRGPFRQSWAHTSIVAVARQRLGPPAP